MLGWPTAGGLERQAITIRPTLPASRLSTGNPNDCDDLAVRTPPTRLQDESGVHSSSPVEWRPTASPRKSGRGGTSVYSTPPGGGYPIPTTMGQARQAELTPTTAS